MTNIKQVIVIRNDLNMRKGKMCAQASHASMMFLTKPGYFNLGGSLPELPDDAFVNHEITEVQREWLEGSFTKVCVRVDSEEELDAIHQAALDAGLVSHMVIDSGKTEFAGVPTKTCIAIGPDYSELIDPVTGHLKLL